MIFATACRRFTSMSKSLNTTNYTNTQAAHIEQVTPIMAQLCNHSWEFLGYLNCRPGLITLKNDTSIDYRYEIS